MTGFSRLICAAMALHLEKKLCKEIDKILNNFIWENNIHYIKKTVILNSYENGGLDVLDLETWNKTWLTGLNK